MSSKKGLKKSSYGERWRQKREEALRQQQQQQQQQQPVMDTPDLGADTSVAAAPVPATSPTGGPSRQDKENLARFESDAAVRAIGSLLDRARACLPHVRQEDDPNVNEAMSLLKRAVSLLEEAPKQPAAAMRAPNAMPASPASLRALASMTSASDRDNRLGSPLLSSNRRIATSAAMSAPNSAFVRKIRMPGAKSGVTSDFESPRLGGRRISSTFDLSAQIAAAASKLQKQQQQQQQPASSSSSQQQEEAGAASQEPLSSRSQRRATMELRDHDKHLASSDDGSDLPPTDEEKADFLRKIKVMGGGVTEDYSSPQIGSRRLGTRKIGGGGGGGNESKRQEPSDDEEKKPSPVAKSAQLLSRMAVDDMATNDRRRADERERMSSTPKAAFIQKIRDPHSNEVQDNIRGLLGRIESRTKVLARDPSSQTVVRVTVLLDLAVKELEELAARSR